MDAVQRLLSMKEEATKTCRQSRSFCCDHSINKRILGVMSCQIKYRTKYNTYTQCQRHVTKDSTKKLNRVNHKHRIPFTMLLNLRLSIKNYKSQVYHVENVNVSNARKIGSKLFFDFGFLLSFPIPSQVFDKTYNGDLSWPCKKQ